MQEVEIPPRDLLQHYVAVSADQRGKTLVWWFSTRRKNISFGLYFKKGRLPAAPSSNVFISTGSSPTDSPQAPSTPQQQQQQRKPQPQPQHRRLRSHRDGQSHPTELSSSPVSGSVHAAAAAGGVTSAASRGRGASNSHNLASLLGTINNSLALAVKGPASPGGGRPQSPSGQNVPGFQLHNALPGSPASAGSSHSPPGLEPPAPGDAAKTSPGALRRGSRPTWSPKDSDMVCIRAIERFDSATSTIKGSHKIDEGDGMFVLVFDNTFSRNTSKRVTFFVAIKDGPPDDEGTAEIAGWLLKKKRKKMQGWATRWFQLDRGTLSYYKSPGAYCRGSVQIAFSAVSVHPSQRLIHIDSGSTIYHLKCLTQTEYQAWMSIIRKYYAVGAMDEDLLRSNRKSFGTTSRLQEGASADPRSTLDERKEPDRQNVPILRPDGSGFQEEALRAISFMKDRHENVVRAAARMLELESGSSMSTAISGSDPSSPKGARSRSPTTGSSGEQGKRRLLKKAASAGFKSANAIAAFSIANCHSEISFALSELKGAQDHVSDLFNEELNRRGALEATLRQLSESTSALASGPLDSVPSSLETSPSLPLVPGSYPSPPALFPPSKTSRSDLPHYFPVSGTVFASGNLPAYNVCEGSRWGESLLNVTGDDEFFDAREIVLEDDSLDEDDNNVGDAQREDEDDEVDDDEEDFSSDMFEARNGTGKSGMGRLSAAGRVPKDSVTTDAAPPSTVPVRASFAAPVQRRHLLPATACVETASIVSIFRKNVGKDFSTIPMPVTTSEPISILQKLAENLEYSELLDIACKQADSATRMLYVAAFVVSGYSNGRGARKPFNPMLGETYELVREDKGFRFIAEKVSHYPVITACHAESEEWVYWHDSRVKAKFWGKSMELIPFGTMHLVLKSSSDHYTWTLPTTWLRNLIGGNKYLEHQGDARIVNHTTGDMCVLQFKESGFFSNAKNEVEGTITVGESRKTMGLTGKWSEVLYHEVEPSQLTILWKARSLLPDADQYYGFTAFTIELNEITADLRGRLPRTDSRLRPDLRLYENGYVDSAEEEKKRVEERQRETRRAMEARGEAWRPAWFELRDDAVDGNPAWVYKGGYWEARQTQQWPDGVELW